MKPGLHPGLSRAAYEQVEGLNFSRLNFMDRSPAHYLQNLMHPKAPTPAMQLGSAIHAAILEPLKFNAEWVVAPKVDRRTNVGKAAWAKFELENAGKGLMTADDYDTCMGMAQAVYAHPVAEPLLSAEKRETEVPAVWDAEGIPMKGCLDLLTSWDGFSWVCDVKSCRDASEFWFAREAHKLRYHAQAAIYLDGLEAIQPYPRRFAWIAVESEPPYAVCVYEPAGSVIDAGRALYRRWIERWKECTKAGRWPAYSERLEPLMFPEWALGRIEE